jgi:hypothetical protein
MKKFVRESTVLKHTNLIGIGRHFDQKIIRQSEIIQILKQTGSVFKNSGCKDIFKQVRLTDNPVELLNHYLFTLKQYNSNSSVVSYFIDKQDDNFLVGTEFNSGYLNINHLFLDWTFLIKKKYPVMSEIIDDILYILCHNFGLRYNDSQLSNPEIFMEQLSDRLYSPDDYCLESEDEKLIAELLNNYERNHYHIEKVLSTREVYMAPGKKLLKTWIDNMPKSRSKKFEALKGWILQAYEFIVEYDDSYTVQYFADKAREEFEAVNESLYEDREARPVEITDLVCMSWFGDTYSTDDLVEHFNMYANEADVADISLRFYTAENERIPFEILESKEYTFLNDISKLIENFNSLRNLFITNKYNYLQ